MNHSTPCRCGLNGCIMVHPRCHKLLASKWSQVQLSSNMERKYVPRQQWYGKQQCAATPLCRWSVGLRKLECSRVLICWFASRRLPTTLEFYHILSNFNLMKCKVSISSWVDPEFSHHFSQVVMAHGWALPRLCEAILALKRSTTWPVNSWHWVDLWMFQGCHLHLVAACCSSSYS